jgi:hypothetical protein
LLHGSKKLKIKKLRKMKRGYEQKGLGLIVAIIVVCASVAAFLVESTLGSTPATYRALDFMSAEQVIALDSSIVPCQLFTCHLLLLQNENWQLTINCTKMPGGANGYTDVYIYNGYWNGGSNYTCTSSVLYPILSSIQSIDRQIRLNSPFTKTWRVHTTKLHCILCGPTRRPTSNILRYSKTTVKKHVNFLCTRRQRNEKSAIRLYNCLNLSYLRNTFV